MTSNPIHMPQGKSWLRLVTEPIPKMKRQTTKPRPARITGTEMMLNGVKIGPLGLSSDRMNCQTV